MIYQTYIKRGFKVCVLENSLLQLKWLCATFVIALAAATAAKEPLGAANATDNCWFDAGKVYHIDPWLLYAIAIKESNLDPSAFNDANRNSSRDIGLMQVNSFWLPELEPVGITEMSLYDPCTSIFVGAWVLAQSMAVFGNTWRAVGAYNAGTARNDKYERLRQNYAMDVQAIYNQLLADRLRSTSKAPLQE